MKSFKPIIAGPKFHATFAATYDEGKWQGTIQGPLYRHRQAGQHLGGRG